MVAVKVAVCHDSSMTEGITVITTSEVARRRGVDSSTVRKWVAEGIIKPASTTEGGHYRFLATDFPLTHPSPPSADSPSAEGRPASERVA